MTLRVLGNIGDAISWGIIGASLTSVLPPLAAGAALIYTGIRIYEYVRWVRRGRNPRERY